MTKNGNIQKVVNRAIPSALIVLIIASIFGIGEKDNKKLQSWAHLIPDNLSTQVSNVGGRIRNLDTNEFEDFEVDDFLSMVQTDYNNSILQCCYAYINTNQELVITTPNYDETVTFSSISLESIGIEYDEELAGSYHFMFRTIDTNLGPTILFYDYNSMQLLVFNPLTLELIERHDFLSEIANEHNVEVGNVRANSLNEFLSDNIITFRAQVYDNAHINVEGFFNIATKEYHYLREGIVLREILETSDRTIGIFSELSPDLGFIHHIVNLDNSELITSLINNEFPNRSFFNNFFIDDNGDLLILTNIVNPSNHETQTEISSIRFNEDNEYTYNLELESMPNLQLTVNKDFPQVNGFNTGYFFSQSIDLEPNDFTIDSIVDNARIHQANYEMYLENIETNLESNNQ